VTGPPRAAFEAVAGDRYRITVFPNLDAGAAGWATGMAFSRNGQPQSGDKSGGLTPPRTIRSLAARALVTSRPARSQAPRSRSRSPVQALPRSAFRVAPSGRSHRRSCLPVTGRRCSFYRRGPCPGHRRRLSAHHPGNGPRSRRTGPVNASDSRRFACPTQRRRPGHPGDPSIPRCVPVDRVLAGAQRATSTSQQPPYRGPTQPSRGACELGATGLPGLTPEWGHTLARITSVTGAQASCCCLASTPTTTFTAGR